MMLMISLVCLFQMLEAQPLPVTECKSACTSTRLDPKMCPDNSDLLAYVSACDIWVTNTATGHEQRCTHVHKGKSMKANAMIIQIENRSF